MPPIECLGVDPIQLPHADREVPLWPLYEKMVVLCEVPNYVKFNSVPSVLLAIFAVFSWCPAGITAHNSVL